MSARRPSSLARVARRVVKWACTVLACAMVVVWVFSGWKSIYWDRIDTFTQAYITCEHGAIHAALFFDSEIDPTGKPYSDYGVFITSLEWVWLPRIDNFGTNSPNVILPLWLPTLLVAVPAAWMWRTDLKRRKAARVGCCATCGYSHAGLGEGKTCPECGAARM